MFFQPRELSRRPIAEANDGIGQPRNADLDGIDEVVIMSSFSARIYTASAIIQ
jgi:hypothetical protein